MQTLLMQKSNWLEALRWTARITSLLSCGLLLLFIFGEEFHPFRIAPKEWIGLFFFPFGVLVGFALAWAREGIGGAVTILSLLAFYFVFCWLLNKELWQGGWFLVFAAPGFLFFSYWLLNRLTAVKAD